MLRHRLHTAHHSEPVSCNLGRRKRRVVLRPFLTRYRYTGPMLTSVFGMLIYFVGVGETSGVGAIAAALGLGALAAATLCLGWDLWLHP